MKNHLCLTLILGTDIKVNTIATCTIGARMPFSFETADAIYFFDDLMLTCDVFPSNPMFQLCW
jgi:hypothetical protein